MRHYDERAFLWSARSVESLMPLAQKSMLGYFHFAFPNDVRYLSGILNQDRRNKGNSDRIEKQNNPLHQPGLPAH